MKKNIKRKYSHDLFSFLIIYCTPLQTAIIAPKTYVQNTPSGLVKYILINVSIIIIINTPKKICFLFELTNFFNNDSFCTFFSFKYSYLAIISSNFCRYILEKISDNDIQRCLYSLMDTFLCNFGSISINNFFAIRSNASLTFFSFSSSALS